MDPTDLQHGDGGHALQPALPDHHVHRAAGLGESSCCRQEPSMGYLRARTGPHRPGRPPAQRRQLRAPTAGDHMLPDHHRAAGLSGSLCPSTGRSASSTRPTSTRRRRLWPRACSARPPPSRGTRRGPLLHRQERLVDPTDLQHGDRTSRDLCPTGRSASQPVDETATAPAPLSVPRRSRSIYDMCWAAGGASLHSPSWRAQ